MYAARTSAAFSCPDTARAAHSTANEVSQYSISPRPEFRQSAFFTARCLCSGSHTIDIKHELLRCLYTQATPQLTNIKALGLDAKAQGCKAILNVEAIQIVIKRGRYNKPRRAQQATLYLSKQGRFTCKQIGKVCGSAAPLGPL